MKHNFSTYVGVSLSIPIFDAFSTRNSVRQAKLQHLSAQLQLDQQSTDLYKTIQLAYYQACGAREKYLASLSTLEKHVARLRQLKKNTISGVQLRLNSSKPKTTSSESKSARYNHIMNTFYATVY